VLEKLQATGSLSAIAWEGVGGRRQSGRIGGREDPERHKERGSKTMRGAKRHMGGKVYGSRAFKDWKSICRPREKPEAEAIGGPQMLKGIKRNGSPEGSGGGSKHNRYERLGRIGTGVITILNRWGTWEGGELKK